MNHQNNGTRARVKKETIRRLDTRALAPAELENVVGGGLRLRKPYTTECPQSY